MFLSPQPIKSSTNELLDSASLETAPVSV
jgi:hypothetical protein